VTRVLLVDDEELVRTGLRMILDAEPDLEVVGEAADGTAAVDRCRELVPDVVLMDIRMPRVSGIEATRRVRALDSPPAVVVLTTFDLDEHVYDALEAGACGFLLKDVPAAQLSQAIRVAASGEAMLAPSVTRRLIERFTARPAAPTAALPGDLTARETEVLRLLAEGMSNTEIAERLFVGDATVKTHVARVLAKCGVRDRVQAVVLAYRSGLVT
jgi:DNA-binding NarL/FixJ family response regulator